jgi:hypothetical protein
MVRRHVFPLSRIGGEGGEGRRPETGEGLRAPTLTLPSLRDGPLPLPQCGRGISRGDSQCQ